MTHNAKHIKSTLHNGVRSPAIVSPVYKGLATASA